VKKPVQQFDAMMTKKLTPELRRFGFQ